MLKENFMKKLQILSLFALGLFFNKSEAIDKYSYECRAKCTSNYCGESRDNWDKCFRNCARSHFNEIYHCTQAASEKKFVDDDQKVILGYLAGTR